jgi:GNAT superfamily N-acetyltransferase
VCQHTNDLVFSEERKNALEIRLLTERDAETLWKFRMVALETDPWSFVESPEELQRMPVAEYAQRVRSGETGNFIFGAFERDQIIGMVGFYQEVPAKRRHKGWIWGVFVAPNARGRGVAKALMLRAIEKAKTLPELDMLLITVSVGQPAPRRLYESLGFRSIGIEPRGLKIGAHHVDEEHMVLGFSRGN